LKDLALQMTIPAFNQWLRPSQGLRWDDGALVVGVTNRFAVDWLENRLKDMIERTLVGVVGHKVGVKFEVLE
jgi:chromosomal replication initiation ATPase DnaA